MDYSGSSWGGPVTVTSVPGQPSLGSPPLNSLPRSACGPSSSFEVEANRSGVTDPGDINHVND